MLRMGQPWTQLAPSVLGLLCSARAGGDSIEGTGRYLLFDPKQADRLSLYLLYLSTLPVHGRRGQ